MTAIKTWIKKQNHQHLLCRDLGHNWIPLTARRTPGGYERQLHCEGCDTVKIQKLDLTGHIITTTMQYTANYLRPPGAGRVTRDEKATIRIAVVRR